MKKNKFLMLISILLLIVMLIGATFSYFAAAASSNENSVSVTAAVVGVGVDITPLYTDKDLIPMNDDDVIKGYQHNCIDDNEFGACYAYNIHVKNNGDKFIFFGTINFNVNDIQNLKYLVLDEENNRYVDTTAIISGEDQTLGDGFELDTDESRDFVLIIWLSNLEEPQDDVDGGGNFSASVTYGTSYGSKITGTFTVSNHGG